MAQEIIYTSAPSGLKPGSRGFCTVVATRGMAKNLADQLEDLSGYRHLHTDGGPQAALNPVAYSHLKLSTGGRTYSVLSRIADAGFDYSQRTNKLAHHIALDPEELPACGPAALLGAPGFMTTNWSGEPHVRDVGPALPRPEAGPLPCPQWRQLAGDAGWAGVVAGELLGPSRRPINLIYRPGTNVLALVDEVLRLLPAAVRRQATFSTYVTKLPPTIDCRWRCYIDGTPEAESAARQAAALVIDLRRPLAPPPSDAAVEAARNGRAVEIKNTPVPPPVPIPASNADADEQLLAALTTPDAVPSPTVPPKKSPPSLAGNYSLSPPQLETGRSGRRPTQTTESKRQYHLSPLALVGIAIVFTLLGGAGVGLLWYLRQQRSEEVIVYRQETHRKSDAAIANRDLGSDLVEEPNNKRTTLRASPATTSDTSIQITIDRNKEAEASKDDRRNPKITTPEASPASDQSKSNSVPEDDKASKKDDPGSAPSNSMQPPVPVASTKTDFLDSTTLPIHTFTIAFDKSFAPFSQTLTTVSSIHRIELLSLDTLSLTSTRNKLIVSDIKSAVSIEAIGNNISFSPVGNPPSQISSSLLSKLRNAVLVCDTPDGRLPVLLRSPYVISRKMLTDSILSGEPWRISTAKTKANEAMETIDVAMPREIAPQVSIAIYRNHGTEPLREIDVSATEGKGETFQVEMGAKNPNTEIPFEVKCIFKDNEIQVVVMVLLGELIARQNKKLEDESETFRKYELSRPSIKYDPNKPVASLRKWILSINEWKTPFSNSDKPIRKNKDFNSLYQLIDGVRLDAEDIRQFLEQLSFGISLGVNVHGINVPIIQTTN